MVRKASASEEFIVNDAIKKQRFENLEQGYGVSLDDSQRERLFRLAEEQVEIIAKEYLKSLGEEKAETAANRLTPKKKFEVTFSIISNAIKELGHGIQDAADNDIRNIMADQNKNLGPNEGISSRLGKLAGMKEHGNHPRFGTRIGGGFSKPGNYRNS